MITWCLKLLIFSILLVFTLGLDNNSLSGTIETFIQNTSSIKYHNYEDVTKFLKGLTERYPSLARLHSIGKSVEGRELWVIEISENVTDRRLGEPMFKYVANMHGDETVGRQLMVYLAQFLLENYGSNARITKLVNNTDIFLMPSLNPDGFEQSREGLCDSEKDFSGRENINHVDLNRNFPDQYDQFSGSEQEFDVRKRQKETLAMMSWISSEPFVLSGNLHGGAVVASYPYDSTGRHGDCCVDAPTPDDTLFRELAKVYSHNHLTMHQNVHCGTDNFTEGITNGAYWYNVRGGMQDYNYLHSNCFEITFELSCCKFPRAAQLAEEWRNNKEALVAFIESTHWGVKGTVRDVADKSAIPGATVSVRDIRHNVTTSGRGEFWRLLLPGRYELQASAPGFVPSKPVVVMVSAGQPSSLEFELQRLPRPAHQVSSNSSPAEVLRDGARLKVVPSPGPDIHGFLLPVRFEHHDEVGLERALRLLNQNFANISRLYSAGRSAQGRELYVLELSSHPGLHRPGVPEVKLVANQHGNEVVGREVLILLATWFCHHYGSDPRATRILDTTRLHLMPSMNPDGYAKSTQNDTTDMVGRTNAMNIDLNRNFPDQYHTNEWNRRAEPETVAMMAWTQSLPFVLSANLHGGSLVANYPFDDNPPGKPDRQANPAPDDQVFRHLADTYAQHHPLMSKGAQCTLMPGEKFSNGTVNGAAWYAVTGGMQDWNYVHSDCFELTIEMGCKKFPPAEQLPKFWEENRDPLLSYIEQVHMGVRGFVTDLAGKPVPGSQVLVDGIEHATRVAKDGDFWRLLTPGTYLVSATAVGFARTSEVVTVPEGSQGLPGGVAVNLSIAADSLETWARLHDFSLRENVVQQNYSSDSELSGALAMLENKYPALAEFQAGDSETSRHVHTLTLSREAGAPDEGKVRVLLLGGMRASQPLGRELLVRLANHLMAGVTQGDATCTRILDQATLTFAPGVDRSFHLTSDACHAAPNDQEVESLVVSESKDVVSEALRSLIAASDLVINLAGGAYSVSTPHSESSSDLELFLSLSNGFTSKHPVLSKTKSLCETSNHTLGPASFEDYVFKRFRIPALTVRLGCCCYPHISQLVPVWQQNVEPLVTMLASALQGVEGSIVDPHGQPVRTAHIKMAGGSLLRVAFSENGAQFRVLLPPGKHRLTVWADGYEGREVTVEVAKGALSNLQVRLDKGEGGPGPDYQDQHAAVEWLARLQASYPAVVRTLPLGPGVQAAQLGLSHPGPAETVPAVAVVLRHGATEARCLPREMALRLAEHLASRFSTDDLATTMLRSSHIFILPLPDPHYADKHERQWSTADTLEWLHSRGPVITAVLGTGGLGVTLPSPSVLGQTPDRQVLRQMAETYVRNNAVLQQRPAPLLANCTAENARQGAIWDSAPEGLLDGAYNLSSTLPLEVLLSCLETPPSPDLGRVWRENREALLALLGRELTRGVKGFVLDEFSGAPVPEALLVADTEGFAGTRHHEFRARPNSGAFWRPLAPGEHALTASAPGYEPLTRLVQVSPAGRQDPLVFRLTRDERLMGVPKMALVMGVGLVFLLAVTCSLLWIAFCRRRHRRGVKKDNYSFQALRTAEYEPGYGEDEDEEEEELPSKNGGLLDRAYRPRPYRDVSSSDDEVDVLVRAGRDDIVISGNTSP